MERHDLVVVGAGPSDLSAAIEAAKRGLDVVVFDENARPGGQLFKQIHKFVVIPAVLMYYLDVEVAAVPRLTQLARRVWGVDEVDDMAAARAGVEAQRSFFASLGMPTTLEAVSGKLEDIPSLASETCFVGGRAGTVGGYLPLDEHAIARIFSLMLALYLPGRDRFILVGKAFDLPK